MKSEMTFEELLEKLKRLDEVTLLELLDLSSEELVDILASTIEDRYDELYEKLAEAVQDEDSTED